MVKESNRLHRQDKEETNLLIVGIPNVGKSSLINTMRTAFTGKGGKPAAVASTPGFTRTVMEKIKISDNPKVYLYDTPGVLEPSIKEKGLETYLRCALCG